MKGFNIVGGIVLVLLASWCAITNEFEKATYFLVLGIWSLETN